MKEQELKRQVAQYWDSQPCGSFASQAAPGECSFYEEVTRHRYARQLYMQELIGFDHYAGQRLLEVGCGLGTDLRQFALGGAQVVGIDLSARSVRLALRHFEVYQTAGDFCNSDAENLPFASATFDVVYSFGVLHHTPNTQRALDECFRVLKPGGRLILMLYNSHSWHVRVDPYLRNAYWLLTGRPGLPGGVRVEEVVRRYDGVDNPLGKAYSLAQVRQMLSRFEAVRLHVCNQCFQDGSILARWYDALLHRSGIYARWGFFIIAHALRPA